MKKALKDDLANKSLVIFFVWVVAMALIFIAFVYFEWRKNHIDDETEMMTATDPSTNDTSDKSLLSKLTALLAAAFQRVA